MLISSSFILGTSDVQFRGDIVRTKKILDTLRGQKVKGKVTNCRGWGGGRMLQGMFGRARAYFRERAYQTKSSDRAHIMKGPLIDCRSFGVVGKPEDISFYKNYQTAALFKTFR